jgi:hypothetical protein
MHTSNLNLVSMDLSLEALENIEAPVDDREAGLYVGIAFGLGLVVGALIVT